MSTCSSCTATRGCGWCTSSNSCVASNVVGQVSPSCTGAVGCVDGGIITATTNVDVCPSIPGILPPSSLSSSPPPISTQAVLVNSGYSLAPMVITYAGAAGGSPDGFG